MTMGTASLQPDFRLEWGSSPHVQPGWTEACGEETRVNLQQGCVRLLLALKWQPCVASEEVAAARKCLGPVREGAEVCCKAAQAGQAAME